MRCVHLLVRAALACLLVGGVSGCATSAKPGAEVSVLNHADPTAERLIAYLESQHVPLTKISGEETRIEPGPHCRQALIRYLNVARMRSKACAENIANIDTTADATGAWKPYRRQIVVLGANGDARTCPDDSPFKREFAPERPEANSEGFVLYPNVDMSIEMMTLSQAALDYSMAATILQRIDPEVVIAGRQFVNSNQSTELRDR